MQQTAERRAGAVSTRGPAPVVVGVDGSETALDALDWAAAEAACRMRPLRVVHAYNWGSPVDPFGVAPGDGTDYRTMAEQVLEEAVARARSVTPDGHITPRLVTGPAAQAMLDESHDADVIVLGTRRFSRLRGLLGRAVGVHIVAHARCPVTIVHPFRVVPPGPSAARVVVGIDGSPHSSEAIRYAFQAAEQRGIGLTAVHSWMSRGPADLECPADTAAVEDVEQQVLDNALCRWRGQFPGVAVERRLVQARPAQALIAESPGAALIVVGSRGFGAIRGALSGSVSQALLHHTNTPVAVVRPRS